MATVIAVTSGKGGTGKTSLTGAVGSCLAALGHPTLCIDMDVGLRNLDLTLGLSDRALMDFTDVAQGRCPLQRAVVEHPDIKGLFLLTAPYTLPGSLTEEAVGADIGNVAQALGTLPSQWDPDADGGFPAAGEPFDPPADWEAFDRASERVESAAVYPPGTNEKGGVIPAEGGPGEGTTIRAKRLAQTGDGLALALPLGAAAAAGALALALRRRRTA